MLIKNQLMKSNHFCHGGKNRTELSFTFLQSVFHHFSIIEHDKVIIDGGVLNPLPGTTGFAVC